MTDRTISIVLADDHPVVRRGLRMLLEAEPDLEVVAEAAGVELLQAIRMTVGGATYLNPELDARVAAEAPERQGPPGDLTEREAEVPRLVALGHTNNEIAGQLYPNVRTRTDSRSSSKTSPHPTSRRRESSRSPSSPYVPREG